VGRYTGVLIAARWLLFLFAALLACPIRYWPLDPNWDNTWIFALNYAAAHGLAFGRDVVWTTGPLGYLVFPQDIGQNLGHALIFQSIVWVVLIAILADLFFRAGFKVRNLALFTTFFAMSAPLYWFNYMGLDSLLLMGALVLLMVERLRGGMERYAVALALIGIIPLIKLTAAMIGCGALIGYLLDRVVRLRRRAWPSIALAVAVPLGVFALGCWCTLPSWNAFTLYLRASLDIAGNYSIAMSTPGDWDEWRAAAAIVVVFAVAFIATARSNRQHAAFCLAVLAIPLFVTFKHGFVRHDMHILNFFCFAGLALGLIALGAQLAGRKLVWFGFVLVAYGGSAMPVVYAWIGDELIQDATGIRNVSFIRGALSPSHLRDELRTRSLQNFGPEDRLDPAIRAIIRDSPVAALSIAYSDAVIDGLNLRLFPVVQKYQAYTPYLDRLNADWIRDRGPRFLIAEWAAIDDRHPWVETPAMWSEIYRWYNTHTMESWSVLLERRASPRFERFELVRRFKLPFHGPMAMPESSGAIFWSMKCGLNLVGRLRTVLFSVPAVGMTVDEASEDRESFRIIPEVLASPVMGNYLPNSKEELAALFDPASTPQKTVNRFTFDGPGLSAYQDTCEVELWRPAP
jgi:hypothetical protein